MVAAAILGLSGNIISQTLIGLAIALPLILLYSLMRRECYVLGRPDLALWGGLTYAIPIPTLPAVNVGLRVYVDGADGDGVVDPKAYYDDYEDITTSVNDVLPVLDSRDHNDGGWGEPDNYLSATVHDDNGHDVELSYYSSPDGAAWHYLGKISKDPYPSVEFNLTDPGRHLITLSVTDKGGLTSEASVAVTTASPSS